MHFGVLVPQGASLPTLVEQFQHAEEVGFDAIYVADHLRDFRDPDNEWFDGWTTLALLSTVTFRARIGTLVTNPILRPPALVAKAAATIDHLSGGRLELGIGTGIAPFDHAAMGSEPWSAKERATRVREYVTVVDGLLRSSDEEPFGFSGEHYRVEPVGFRPPPVQRPRPPITVGGQSPTVRRVAAEIADCWNTHGGYGLDLDEIVELTRSQMKEMDRACEAAGRDPAAVRRSVLCFAGLDPWPADGSGRPTFREVIDRFDAIGMTEFVTIWPRAEDDALDMLRQVARLTGRA